MLPPNYLYDLLLDHADSNEQIERLVIGLVWTLCQTANKSGLAMSPGINTRTLPWSGDLHTKTLKEVASWIRNWDLHQAAIGLAAINCCINSREFPDSIVLTQPEQGANLAVFDYFLPQLLNKKVVVIGHYPGIEQYQQHMQLIVLEQQPSTGDLPAAACEYMLPTADWVFLTASSIVNKTFPRLAELARPATTVLMGPSLPWLPQFHEFGIDYLAGVEVINAEQLFHTVAQGGGVRIFQHSVQYRVAALTPASNLQWLRQQITECAAQRQQLLQEMEQWYASADHKNSRFPSLAHLEQTNHRLSRLDTSFKSLWDIYGRPGQS